MKKEEPLINSVRGNRSCLRATGSLSRPGRTALARIEKPALRLNREFLTEPVADAPNIEPALLTLLRIRTKSFVEPPYAEPHVRWCGGWAGKPARLPDLVALHQFSRQEFQWQRTNCDNVSARLGFVQIALTTVCDGLPAGDRAATLRQLPCS